MLGNNIKRLRKSRKMTQQDLSQILHVSQQTIGAWETNRVIPGSDTLLTLSDFFGVPTDQLLGREKLNSNNVNILYINIKNLATERDISLAQIERDLHFSNGLISSWKNSQASQDKLSALADYFNVSVDYILGRDTDVSSDNTLRLNIIKLRESYGLSQNELAQRIGIHNSCICKIENGTRRVSTSELNKFSKIFNVSADYLLGNDTKCNNSHADYTALETALNKAKSFDGIPMTARDRKIIRGILKGYFTYKD